MSENKTQPTSASVDDFLATVSETRQAEARTLIALMQNISDLPPVMWGPSIIGFGTQHYKSEAGREGDMGILGFSPRKSALTVYFYEGFDRYGEELGRLGKHTTSVGCLYIPKLSNIDLSVLESMLRASYKLAVMPKEKPTVTVDEYVAQVPTAARPLFDELRAIVRAELPKAREVVSYGIVGYKIDDKRARVFISGWKDHVAMYPIPKDEKLQEALRPYTKGKGTLWFTLDKKLPVGLIKQTIKALTAK